MKKQRKPRLRLAVKKVKTNSISRVLRKQNKKMLKGR